MKLKAGLVVVALLLFNIFIVKGQGDVACDPDLGCPLDTWTYILVFVALAFVSFRLYNGQKSRPI